MGSSIHPRNVDYAAFDEVHWVGIPALPWAALTLTGLACAAAVAALDRRAHLSERRKPTAPTLQAVGSAGR